MRVCERVVEGVRVLLAVCVLVGVRVLVAGGTQATTRVGAVALSNVQLPSCPPLLLPQQKATPALVRAQVCILPTTRMLNVNPNGMITAVGVVLPVVVPVPSCPFAFAPQQNVVPALVRAQV